MLISKSVIDPIKDKWTSAPVFKKFILELPRIYCEFFGRPSIQRCIPEALRVFLQSVSSGRCVVVVVVLPNGQRNRWHEGRDANQNKCFKTGTSLETERYDQR